MSTQGMCMILIDSINKDLVNPTRNRKSEKNSISYSLTILMIDAVLKRMKL